MIEKQDFIDLVKQAAIILNGNLVDTTSPNTPLRDIESQIKLLPNDSEVNTLFIDEVFDNGAYPSVGNLMNTKREFVAVAEVEYYLNITNDGLSTPALIGSISTDDSEWIGGYMTTFLFNTTDNNSNDQLAFWTTAVNGQNPITFIRLTEKADPSNYVEFAPAQGGFDILGPSVNGFFTDQGAQVPWTVAEPDQGAVLIVTYLV